MIRRRWTLSWLSSKPVAIYFMEASEVARYERWSFWLYQTRRPT